MNRIFHFWIFVLPLWHHDCWTKARKIVKDLTMDSFVSCRQERASAPWKQTGTEWEEASFHRFFRPRTWTFSGLLYLIYTPPQPDIFCTNFCTTIAHTGHVCTSLIIVILLYHISASIYTNLYIFNTLPSFSHSYR